MDGISAYIIFVAPHAGAGIEIGMLSFNHKHENVAPHAGAGIEIGKRKSMRREKMSPPTRGRELK